MRQHLSPVRMAIFQKTRDKKCWWGGGEKGPIAHCWWECKLVQPLQKTVWSFFRNLKIKLPYAIPLLDTYLKEIKWLYQRDIYTPMSIAALFTIRTKRRKQPKYLSMDERMKKIQCTYHSEMLFSLKMEGNLAIGNIMDEPEGHYATWNNRHREQKVPDSTYVRCIK